jgi:raffinose/stachyose/melibiose transport system substrate-binding protein
LTTDAFNKAMWDGLQSVLAGQMTPHQVADSLEAAAKKSASGA